MQIKWVIEQYDFVENIDSLLRAIKTEGDEVHIVQYKPFVETTDIPFKYEDCVIAIGTIGFVDRIQRTRPWIPGSFATFRNYECTGYYPTFGHYLLNSDYVMLPLGEIRRRFSWLQKALGTKSLFVRPSSGRKPFSGQILRDELDIQVLDQVSPETLCVVSSRKTLGCEFRYFVTPDEVLDGSMYYDSFGVHKPENINQLYGADAFQEALCRIQLEEILNDIVFVPDAVYCIDMCYELDAKQPKVMEIGAFSTSGWYATSPDKVVSEARKSAIAEWKEYNG